MVAALPLDAAADQMAARYLRSRMPLFDTAGQSAAEDEGPREQLEATDRVQVSPYPNPNQMAATDPRAAGGHRPRAGEPLP